MDDTTDEEESTTNSPPRLHKRERASSFGSSTLPAVSLKRESTRIAQWFIHWASSRDCDSTWRMRATDETSLKSAPNLLLSTTTSTVARTRNSRHHSHNYSQEKALTKIQAQPFSGASQQQEDEIEEDEPFSEPFSQQSTDESVSRLLRNWIGNKIRASITIAGPRFTSKRALVNTLLHATCDSNSLSSSSSSSSSPNHHHHHQQNFNSNSTSTLNVSEEFHTTNRFASKVNIEEEENADLSDDLHSYILPQGMMAVGKDGLPHIYRVKYGRICEATVSFIGESDLRSLLWEDYLLIIGKKTQSIKTTNSTTLEEGERENQQASLQISKNRFFSVISETIQRQESSNWTSSKQLPIPKHLCQLLGRSFSFRGNGRSNTTDRVYIRTQLQASISSWGPLISLIEVHFPSSLLRDGSCELFIIDSDVTYNQAVSPIIRQQLRESKFLILTVDSTRGITSDIVELIKSTHFLQGMLSMKNSKQIAIVELLKYKEEEDGEEGEKDPNPSTIELSDSFEERSKIHQQSIAKLLLELPLDKQLPIVKEAIERAISDLLILQVSPSSFLISKQSTREKINLMVIDEEEETKRKIFEQEEEQRKQLTNIPALICAIKNISIIACGEELCSFSESWMYRLTEGTKGPSLPIVTTTTTTRYSSDEFSEKSRSWTDNTSTDSFGSLNGSSGDLNSISIPSSSTSTTSNNNSLITTTTTFSMKLDQLTESLRRHLHVTPRPMKDTIRSDNQPLPTMEQLISTFRSKLAIVRKALLEREIVFHQRRTQETSVTTTTNRQNQQHLPTTFEEAAHECKHQAEIQWPSFKEKFLSSRESCQVVLNPKFEGECLGADVKKLLCQPLVDFAVALWTGPVMKTLQKAEESISALIHETFGSCGRIAEQRPLDQNERLQFRQFLWQNQEGAEKSTSAHFQQIRSQLSTLGMDENSSSERVLSCICRNIITSTLLSKANREMTIKQFQQLVEKSFSVIPSKCIPAIKVHFSNVLLRICSPHFNTIEERVLQSLNGVISFTLIGSNKETSSPQQPTIITTNVLNPKAILDVQIVTTQEIQQGIHSPTQISQILSNKQSPVAINAGQQREFIKMLRDHGLKIVETTTDLNSQFRSLAHLIYGTEDAHTMIRLLSVLEILHNPEDFGPLVRGISTDLRSSIQVYSSEMSKDDIPGDQVTLLAFAALSRVDVLIYSPVFSKPLLLPSINRNKHHSLALPTHFANAIKRAASINSGGMLILRLAMIDTGIYQPIVIDELTLQEVLSQQEQEENYCCHSSKTRKSANLSDQKLQDQQHWQQQQQSALLLQQSPRQQDQGENMKSLVDICVSQIAYNICSCPSSAPQALPEELVLKILSKVVSEHTCDGVDFDIMLMKLLHLGVTTLDLSGCTYLTKYSLIEAARACLNLRTLALCNCPRITDDDIGLLAQQCKNLSSVNLSKCALIGDGALIALAANCKDISHVSVSGCQRIGVPGLQALRNSPIQVLEISGCEEVTDQAIVGFETLCIFDASHCPKLTDSTLSTLSKCGNTMRCAKFSSKWITDRGLASFVSCAPILEVLDVCGCIQISTETINALFQNCPRMQRFLIAGCTLVSDSSFPFNDNNILNSHKYSTNLVVLNANECSITDKTLIQHVAHCPQLTSLSIAGCSSITDKALAYVVSKLPLTRLNVSRCPLLTDMNLCELAKRAGERLKDIAFAHTQVTNLTLGALSLSCFHLKQIDCSYCLQVSDEGMCRLVKECPFIEALAIEGCNMLTDTVANAISQSCKHLKILKAAYLQHLTDSGIALLGNCKLLEMIDISYDSQITISGVQSFLCGAVKLSSLQARGLVSATTTTSIITSFNNQILCPSLRSINLAWFQGTLINQIVVLLAKWCPSLENVNASRCPNLTDEAVRQLVGRCPNIRQLNIAGCPLVLSTTVRFLALSGVGVST